MTLAMLVERKALLTGLGWALGSPKDAAQQLVRK
jgi:hypothetical protein